MCVDSQLIAAGDRQCSCECYSLLTVMQSHQLSHPAPKSSICPSAPALIAQMTSRLICSHRLGHGTGHDRLMQLSLFRFLNRAFLHVYNDSRSPPYVLSVTDPITDHKPVLLRKLEGRGPMGPHVFTSPSRSSVQASLRAGTTVGTSDTAVLNYLVQTESTPFKRVVRPGEMYMPMLLRR